MTATKASATGTPDAVQFVNEDNRRSLFACLLKHLAHSACTHADKHLDEFRPRGGKERHICLACKGTGQKCLAGARWTHQQDTMRYCRAHFLKPIRVAQELHKFGDLALGLILPGDILKGDFAGGFCRFGGPAAKKITHPTRQPAADTTAHHTTADP